MPEITVKNHKIFIADSVKVSLQKQVDYISFEQGEPLIAVRWIDGIMDAITSLSHFPHRCPIAPENFYVTKDSEIIIRHFIYKKSFRIIFTVVKNEVRVLSVKHAAQEF